LKPASPSDYRAVARRRLPHFLFEYIDGGSYDETTLAANVSDLQRLRLRQRVACDVSHVDLSTNLFGQEWSMPVALGPIGLAGSLQLSDELLDEGLDIFADAAEAALKG